MLCHWKDNLSLILPREGSVLGDNVRDVPIEFIAGYCKVVAVTRTMCREALAVDGGRAVAGSIVSDIVWTIYYTLRLRSEARI